MVGLESFLIRKDELIKRRAPLVAEWEHFRAAATDTPENQQRGAELLTALHIMDGRLLELDAWIGMLEKFPGVTRPGQLPTKGNTPAYVPVTANKTPAQVSREREAKFQHDASELVALQPDAQPLQSEGHGATEGHDVRRP